jgi:hypothetical protein
MMGLDSCGHEQVHHDLHYTFTISENIKCPYGSNANLEYEFRQVKKLRESRASIHVHNV